MANHPLANGNVAMCTLTFMAQAASMTCVTTVLPQYFRDAKLFDYRVDNEYLAECQLNSTRQQCKVNAPLAVRTYVSEHFKNGLLFALSSITALVLQPALADATTKYDY